MTYTASHNGFGTTKMQNEKIHEARVEALKKENFKDENLRSMDKEVENRLDGTLYIRRRSRHHHLCQQVLDVFKDEERLSEAIRFTSTTRNTPLEIGKYRHGFYHKTTKDNKQLRHDLGSCDHQRSCRREAETLRISC
ncbi:hypothetical protein Tco_0842865 [Tanacetum coccineum]|uniref:Uncharacterized protein n=1 Tax=Tanacetum coccineum TaxID=301880 RepID=A0ABQ5B4E2_9ASTR